jgi:hypothetical protein
MFRRNLLISCCLLLAGSFSASAASQVDPEDFKLELTGSVWILNSSGQIQANGSPIDIVKDLAAAQNQPTFFGKLVFKPGRRHRILVEGAPYRLGGSNTVTRTIVYHDEVFNVNENIRWSAGLNYVFGGYQYDLISNRMGHLGLSVGGAYLSGTGAIRALPDGPASTKSQTIGLPLAGVEFRIFPIPEHPIFEINGGMRGIGLGDYGHYVEGTGSAGIMIGHLAFEGGYRAVNANLHDSREGGSRLFLHLNGPIVSLSFRY